MIISKRYCSSGKTIAQFRRQLVSALGTRERFGGRAKLLVALLIFLVSYSTKSLVAVDLSPVMHTASQPAGGMASEYDERAVSILDGHGLLIPDDQDAADTRLLGRAPGYSIFLGALYSLFGRSYFNAQVVQNIINSIAPIMIFFLAALVISWRVGAVAGFLAAVSHHLSYYSNFILPDSVCALPILATVYLLTRAERCRRKPLYIYAVAGVMIGASVWLRPNILLMGPFLAAALVASRSPRRDAVKRAVVMAAVSLLVIAPITIRNYLIYGEFVPVSTNLGIVLWEGMAEYGGEEFGAVANDNEVAAQEAIWYGQPIYANTWQTPDGIKRDRDRVKRSIEVISNHPVWYTGTVLRRMRDMFKYSAQAPIVFRASDTALIEAGEKARAETLAKIARGKPLLATEQSDVDRGSTLWFGQSISSSRPLVRATQRITKETMLLFIIAGAPIVFLLSCRRAFFIAVVPIYFMLTQGLVHTEFRYTLPMQYFVFVFAAVSWVLIGGVVWKVTQKILSTKDTKVTKKA